MKLLAIAGVVLGVMKLVGVAAVATLSWWVPALLFFSGFILAAVIAMVVGLVAYFTTD